MFRKLGHLILYIVFITIIAYGFIKVSSEITPYVKEKSNVKVYYTAKPFDVSIHIGDYIVYINDKAFNNIKGSATQVFENIGTFNPIEKLIDGNKVK